MKSIALTLLVLAAGCGHRYYQPPVILDQAPTALSIPVAKDGFWKAFVPALSRELFVINNLDKETGLINASYSGDPEKFVDCGRIISRISNVIGGKTYDFPAAKANQQYEIRDGLKVVNITRQMQLEGRINILVEEVESNLTRVSVNTRYGLNRRVVVRDGDGASDSHADTINFSYGQDATLTAGDQTITCRPTGALERKILGIVEWAAIMK